MMNRKLILEVVVMMFIFTTNGLFAVELWNGFTTEMTREDVIARIRIVSETGEFSEFSESSSSSPFRVGWYERTISGQNISALFPKYEFIIKSTNATFQFRNGKLFLVIVENRMHPNEFYPLLVRQYGEPVTGSIVEITRPEMRNRTNPPDYSCEWRWYRWETSGRVIFSYRSNGRCGNCTSRVRMYVYSKQVLDNFAQEQAEEEARQKAEQDRQREERQSGVVF